MIMFVAGLAAVIAAISGLSRLRKTDRRRAVAEFNQQFVSDTRSRVADVEAGERRAEIARSLGIGGK